MNKGSTPKIRFSTPLPAGEVVSLSVVFANDEGSILIEKDETDVTVGDYEISFTLSQIETLGLPDTGAVEAQIRIRDTSGTAYVSNIVRVDVGRVLKEGLL